jgi:low affinity Fe/Cu permease
MSYRYQTLLIILLSFILQNIYVNLVDRKAKLDEKLKDISLAISVM